MEDYAIRQELVEYGKKLITNGLVTAAAGNLSTRVGDTIYLSPSGISFDELSINDYVAVDIKTGNKLRGDLKPTSESNIHLECYKRRSDISAIFHTHPKYTLALSSSGHDIRAMLPDFHIYCKAPIPHLDYITARTKKLADAVGEKCLNTKAIVLRNHGAITFGSSLKEAYYSLLTLEEGAQIQWLAQCVGKPRFLTEKERADLNKQFT